MSKKPAPETSLPPASFEDCLVELQSIVSDLENGTLGLEASLARFEAGIGLLRACHLILESAEARVEVLTRLNREAPPETVPFDASATFQPADGEPDGNAGNGLSLF